MLTINSIFILRKSVNYSVNLFSNRNMNSATVYCLQLDGSGLWPICDVNSNDIPPCSGITVHVIRKPGTALGMSIAGGHGSIPFIGNDEVTNHDTNYLRCHVEPA